MRVMQHGNGKNAIVVVAMSANQHSDIVRAVDIAREFYKARRNSPAAREEERKMQALVVRLNGVDSLI